MDRTAVIYFVFLTCLKYCWSGCNIGWIHYHNSCYLFSQDSKNWDDAQFHCLIYGAKVAEIETMSENNFIRIYLMDHFGNDHHSWVGATDEQSEGQWVWIKDQMDVTYTDWSPGEPDNLQGNEDCLFLDGNVKYRWNDAPCDIRLKFICEQNLA